MFSFGIAYLVSLVIGFVILRLATGRGHRRLLDDDLAGVQKLHHAPVPRVGGVAIFLAALVGAGVIRLANPVTGTHIFELLACVLPSFLGGVGEDITKRVSPRWRLVGMAASAALAWWAIGLRIPRVDMPWLDAALTWAPASFVLTLLALLTITNAVNLIDGLNGLAGMVTTTMFGALAVVGWRVGDPFIVSGSLLMMGAILGFLFWNWPRGHLFLGDGGAYFLGFVLGAMSIMLVARNPRVSAWFPVLLLSYPLTEVAFSVWRRRVLRGANAALPDASHLHQLIYRRLVLPPRMAGDPRICLRSNSRSSPYLWLLTALAVVPAVLLFDSGMLLALGAAGFVTTYLWLYSRIARLRSPSWLRMRR
ncbi:glycosyltransferase family 4 protein [Derxia gummosa]|uniref:Glycosyltransferase family 4 protein n=1 Tax=Derxia gummosa DSM 723 TaxID=1121388 RepID=A0A8B6X1R4_9BURK|nr:glycosyltransferase [Derxia gummosa]